MDLSFSGAGFMGCYYFGVVNCWNKYIPRERVRRAAGASAGSLIAAYYLMDLPLDTCLKEIVSMMEDVRSRPLGVFDRSNQIVDVLPKVLDKLLPDDAHKRVNGRLFVSMTRLKDMKSVIVNQFDSKKDLIDALNCSCFIPVWSGNHVATYKGAKYIDGGFTNNLPVFDEHTIRICCFSGASDIAPADKDQQMTGNAMGMPFNINWKNLKRGGRALWPPPPSFVVSLLEGGFHDTKDFILSNDLIQCDGCFNSTQLECQPIYSKVTPTISPAASPSVSRASSFMNLSDVGHRSASFRKTLFGGQTKSSTATRQDTCKGKKQHSKVETPATSTKKVHIKEHRQQQAAVSALFEQDRSKSGKQIKHKCLQRSQSEVSNKKLAQNIVVIDDTDNNNEQQVARVSFATKLREKLQRVASSATIAPPQRRATDDCEQSSDSQEMAPPMPTIVIEEAAAQLEESSLALACDDDAENDRQIVSIMEIMESQEREEEEEDQEQQQQLGAEMTQIKRKRQQQRRSASMSSSGSSTNDSAVGLDAPSPPLGHAAATAGEGGAPIPGSPAEKFFSSSTASRQHRAASLASVAPLTAEQQARLQQVLDKNSASPLAKSTSNNHLNASLMPDRFSFAPSPLPSCPPSPNLNRHCTECIRLRQQARMDGIDEVLRREAELYSTMKTKDPEREFNSFRARLTNWLRSLGTTKYSYSFDYDEDEENQQQQSAASRSPKKSKARARTRRASLTTSTPPSEIPSFSP